MKALEFMDILREKFAIPWSTEGQDCSSTKGMASRSEVKRWLKMGFGLMMGVTVCSFGSISDPQIGSGFRE